MSKKKKRRNSERHVDSWMNDLRISDGQLLPEGFGSEHLRDFADYAYEVAVEELQSEGEAIPRLVGIDEFGRGIYLFQGERGSAPRATKDSGVGLVSLGSDLFDNETTIRKVFARLGIRAAMLVAEVWVGDVEADTLAAAGFDHRSQALGRAEAIVVDVLCPDIGYHRSMVAPMVRLDSYVTASLLGDSEEMDKRQAALAPLAPFFPSHLLRMTEREPGSGGRAAS